MWIPASVLGMTAGPREQTIDARWLMAYAAALDEHAPQYFDTTRSAGILAHPVFPVCYEWPLVLDIRARILAAEVAMRGVHASHRLILHRRPRAGDRLSTVATVAALERRSPGAYVLIRLETTDAAGQPVTTTEYGSLYLGVDCDAPPRTPRAISEFEASPHGSEGGLDVPEWSVEVPIAPTLAHVYTECARIWNPIHTDRAVARDAGLPDIILHGTATLGLAMSQVLRRPAWGVAAPVRSMACRFGAMVRLPSRLTVRGWSSMPSPQGSIVRFEALTENGQPAIRDGQIILGP
jgi:acyl dehydratase